MEGEKLRAMQQSLKFLVRHGLQEQDRLGLVVFNDEVATPFELTTMDAAGRQLVEVQLTIAEQMMAAQTAAASPRPTPSPTGGQTS